MKHSERFTNAVTKLYNAFHNGTLNAWDCTMCAVGSICDNTASWALFRVDGFNTGEANYVTPKTGYLKHAKDSVEKSLGYSPVELINIEKIFLDNFNGKASNLRRDKEAQFNGLCAVVGYLCELEGIPNVMDYGKLFETEDNKPKYELSL